VLQIEPVPGEPFDEPLPVPPRRPSLLGALRRASARLTAARQLSGLLEALLDALAQELDIAHAMVLVLDGTTQRLYTVASRGYATSGVGSEIPLGHGVIGVAARERTPVRINHMTSAFLYNQAMRQGMDASDGVSTDIPYPGLPAPRSQLAVPLVSADRVLGVLFVESGQDMRFSYEDEDLLVALGAQLAAAMALMQSSEEVCDEAAPPVPAVPAGATGTRLRVRRYRSNDSIFINNAYLIKGVAGAILWKLLTEHQRGRHDFTNRELRLDASLRLPDVADNLEARLLLLNRRLAEQCPQLRLHKTARGCFRLDVLGTTELEESP
jgi:adenylate cyclase